MRIRLRTSQEPPKRSYNWKAIIGGFIGGALGGVEVSSQALPLIVVDPTGTTAGIVISGAAIIGGVGGALGAAGLTSETKTSNDDPDDKE